MNKTKETELTSMKKDIKEMHKIMNNSASLFRFIYSAKNFRSFFLIAGIVLGLILNMIGVMIREKEYSYAGSWFILSRLIGFLFLTIPVHLALGVIFAPGCFLFTLIAYLKKKKE